MLVVTDLYSLALLLYSRFPVCWKKFTSDPEETTNEISGNGTRCRSIVPKEIRFKQVSVSRSHILRSLYSVLMKFRVSGSALTRKTARPGMVAVFTTSPCLFHRDKKPLNGFRSSSSISPPVINHGSLFRDQCLQVLNDILLAVLQRTKCIDFLSLRIWQFFVGK